MSCTKDKWCLIKEIKVIPEITNKNEKSQAFLKWTKKITYQDNYIVLPDGSKIDGKIWMDNQLRFDNGSYTKFLMNYFNYNI